MQAVIMAGGKGTRMRPYTNILPKPLLPIGQCSIIEINIKQLAKAGVKEIIISVGYLGELIESVIGSGEKYNLKIEYSYENKPMGTVGSLFLISEKLNENFIVMNGDILHNVNFKSLLDFHNFNDNLDVTITTSKYSHQVPLGVLDIENNNVIKYIEKPISDYLVSMGIYALNKKLINKYVTNNSYMDFPTLINNLIKNNQKIQSYVHEGLWVDLGTTAEYVNIINELEKIKEDYPEIPILL